jgi:hypothetical protein
MEWLEFTFGGSQFLGLHRRNPLGDDQFPAVSGPKNHPDHPVSVRIEFPVLKDLWPGRKSDAVARTIV